MIDDDYLSRSRDLKFTETLRRDGWVDWELRAWLGVSQLSETPEGDEPAEWDPVIVRAIEVEVDVAEEDRGDSTSLETGFEFLLQYGFEYLLQNAADVAALLRRAADVLRIGLRPDVTPFLMSGTIGGRDALLRVTVLTADVGRAVAGRLRGLADQFADILREMQGIYRASSRSSRAMASTR